MSAIGRTLVYGVTVLVCTSVAFILGGLIVWMAAHAPWMLLASWGVLCLAWLADWANRRRKYSSHRGVPSPVSRGLMRSAFNGGPHSRSTETSAPLSIHLLADDERVDL